MPLALARSPVVLPGAYDPLRSLPVVYLDAARSVSTLAAGMAAQFTAATFEYLTVADAAALRVASGASITFFAMVYLDSAVSPGVILAKAAAEPAAAGDEFELDYRQASSAFRWIVRNAANDATTNINADTFGAASTATWYGIFAWYDADLGKLRISVNNGTTDSVDYSGGIFAGTNAFTIGSVAGGGSYWDGRIGPVYRWNRALSDAERTTVYGSGTPLTRAQLLAAGLDPVQAWELNEPSGARKDLVGDLSLTDTNTVTTAAGTVLNAASQKGDISGNSRNAAQATQANKSVYRANYVNGQPAWVYDGVNDFDTITDFTYGDGSALTVFAVAKGVTGSAILGHWDSGAVQKSWQVGVAANKLRVLLSNHPAQGPGTFLNYSGGTTVADNTWHVVGFYWDAGTLRLFVDSATPEALTKTTDNAITTYCNSTAALSLGSLLNNGAAFEPWNGAIKEVIIIPRAVPNGELAKLIRDMGRRAGIAIS